MDAARAARAARAIETLAQAQAFAQRYDVAPGTPPMLFALGDGNRSLATAKSIWEQVKARLGMDHPSRYALVEVENIHDAGLHFAPIHRLLTGLRADLRAALAAEFGRRLTCTEVPTAVAMRERVQAIQDAPAAPGATGARQAFGLIEPDARFAVVEIAEPPSSLAVGTVQAFVDRFVDAGGAALLDYVHGDEVLERLAQTPGSAGLHLAGLGQHELLRRVVLEGPLPRKTFSMGEAHEKRYYIEARRIR